MQLFLVGVNHKTAPVEVRERVAFSPRDIPSVLRQLKEAAGLDEAVLISTCNRTEVVAAAKEHAVPGVQAFLMEWANDAEGVRDRAGSSPLLEPGHFYEYADDGAVVHLFRVAAGLDSMVVGEAQILGQVRQALSLAQQAGTAGAVTVRLMQAALHVGKRVRTETGIGEGAASISQAAVELALQVFGELSGREVLLVGAGKTSELAARNLVQNGMGTVFVANRTFAKAKELAAAFGGVAIPFEHLAEWLGQVDIVISSTGAPGYVITAEMVRSQLARRRGKPLFLVDLAVPRDVDPRVHQLDGVFLYNIDDLQQVVAANLKERQSWVQEAEAIVADEAEAFSRWLIERKAAPIIAHLRMKAEMVRRQETERVLRRLAHLSEEDKDHIRALTATLVNKLLHEPTVQLKEAARRGDGLHTLAAVARLYGFDFPAELGSEREKPAKPEGRRRPHVPSRAVKGLAPEGGCQA